MKVVETTRFRKSLKSLSAQTKKRTKKQFGIFLTNLFHPSLHTEKLEPKENNIWSFRVDKSTRVIFTFSDKETITLLDIGPHDIYRKV